MKLPQRKKLIIRNKAKKQQHVSEVIDLFKRYYPKPKCALNYSTAEELLIATILSAQCTDERVNQVTESLFKKYPSLQSFAEAKLEDLEVDIRPTGFYKNKAKNIIHCCKTLLQEFGGQLPKTVEEMTQLGGVGRKTANVVLGNAFNIASGVVVDTHVTRLSNRLGWVKGRDAVKIEMQLNELVPKKYWVVFPHWMITHGRAVCKARKPRCEECFLEELCPKKPY
jgi:endonuclease-3